MKSTRTSASGRSPKGVRRSGSSRTTERDAAKESGGIAGVPLSDPPLEAEAGPKAGECVLAADPGEYWRWCPRCGHELHNEKCKLRCPRCHYFMSCSDFD
jgi:hypothetical protein